VSQTKNKHILCGWSATFTGKQKSS